MGDPRSLKAYQVSERLALDCISKYIKCCCTLTGYLIRTVPQRGRTALRQSGEVGEVLSAHRCLGRLAVFFLHATYA